jgi:hypothetical protein
VDPWHDYLAFPIAPFLLLAQAVALFVPPRWVRLVFTVGCTVAIAVMFAYVASLDIPTNEGANIGAGVLALWLAISIVLLVVELVREGVGSAWRRFRRPSKSATSGL